MVMIRTSAGMTAPSPVLSPGVMTSSTTRCMKIEATVEATEAMTMLMATTTSCHG